MTTTLEIAVPETAKVVPKPTRKDIRLAMAQAVHDEQVKNRDEFDKRIESARKDWNKRALALLKKHGKFCDPYCWGGGAYVKLEIDSDAPGFREIRDAHDALGKSRPTVESVRDIEARIMTAQREMQGDAVKVMLGDQKIRKALLEAANQIV